MAIKRISEKVGNHIRCIACNHKITEEFTESKNEYTCLICGEQQFIDFYDTMCVQTLKKYKEKRGDWEHLPSEIQKQNTAIISRLKKKIDKVERILKLEKQANNQLLALVKRQEAELEKLRKE